MFILGFKMFSFCHLRWTLFWTSFFNFQWCCLSNWCFMEIFIITRIRDSFYYEFKLHWWKWHHFETTSFEAHDDCCRWKWTIWLNHETALYHVCMLIYFMSGCKPLNRVQQSTVLFHTVSKSISDLRRTKRIRKLKFQTTPLEVKAVSGLF